MHYRTRRFLDGDAITFTQANYIFRQRILQARYGRNGVLALARWPIAWVRWAGVTVLGRKAWNHD